MAANYVPKDGNSKLGNWCLSNDITNFLDKYNDIALLADLMGHESIETTRIYLRRTATEQQSLIDKIVTW